MVSNRLKGPLFHANACSARKRSESTAFRAQKTSLRFQIESSSDRRNPPNARLNSGGGDRQQAGRGLHQLLHFRAFDWTLREIRNPQQMMMNPQPPRLRFSKYLQPFNRLPLLQVRVQRVLESLPPEVQADFLTDDRFQVGLDNFQPGVGWSFVMPAPGPKGSGSRCVILRPKLEKLSEAFANYVIAHEFAHAFLRNGGWGDISDPEQAADALASAWGFDRPLQNAEPIV